MENSNKHIGIFTSEDVLKNNFAHAVILDDANLSDNKELESAIEQGTASILEERDENFIIAGGEDNKGSVVIFFFEQSKINALLHMFESHGILKEDFDVSDECMTFEFSNERVAKLMSKNRNTDTLNSFIRKNLDMDFVLEKISQKGMESLSELEREFLDNQ